MLYDGQPEADSVAILGRGPLQLAKPREQLGQVFLCDARARVLDMHNDALQVVPVARLNLNLALVCEFYRVFDQVYHDLLKAPHVTDDFRQLRRLIGAWLGLATVEKAVVFLVFVRRSQLFAFDAHSEGDALDVRLWGEDGAHLFDDLVGVEEERFQREDSVLELAHVE